MLTIEVTIEQVPILIGSAKLINTAIRRLIIVVGARIPYKNEVCFVKGWIHKEMSSENPEKNSSLP